MLSVSLKDTEQKPETFYLYLHDIYVYTVYLLYSTIEWLMMAAVMASYYSLKKGR